MNIEIFVPYLWGVYFFLTTTFLFTMIDLVIDKKKVYAFKKIQSDKEIMWNKLTTSSIIRVSTNLFIVTPITIFLLDIKIPLANKSYENQHDAHYYLVEFCKFIAAIIMFDFMFYTIHYTMHKVNILYRLIHKYHHKWSNPLALAALDSHPIEHLLTNVIPTYLVAYITKMEHITVVIWSCITMTYAVISHSGFKITKYGSIDHDNHHKYLNVDFGTGFGIADYLMNTHYKR